MRVSSDLSDELKIREEQLKETLSEIARVNEQREVDALELKRTQDEMMKLAERIMENSLYIKEMEVRTEVIFGLVVSDLSLNLQSAACISL